MKLYNFATELIVALVHLWNRFVRWGIDTRGSSRSSALIRIGLVLIIWARFAAEQQFFRHELGWRTLFSACFYVFTVAMLIGYKSRISTFIVGCFVMFIYSYFDIFLGEEAVSSHMYWLAIAPLLCALTPCDRSYSFDRWLALRRAKQIGHIPLVEEGNLWGLRLIVVQLSMMYFWTAINKMQLDFVSGDRLEAIAIRFYPNAIDVVAYTWAFVIMSWIVVILEFSLAFGMPFNQSRPYLVIPGLLLHGVFYPFLPVQTYSITIILLYLAYFDANKVHKIIDELSGVAQGRAQAQRR